MRIRFKKSNLLPAAAIAQSVANPQSPLPILTNALITTEHDNVVAITATDFDTRVRIEVPAVVEKKGSATVPARMFLDLIKELPEDDDVIFETMDSGAVVRSRGVRCDLQTLPVRDFPNWPEVNATATFDIEQRALKSLIAKVLFAVPVRDPRKVLLGALLEFREEGLSAVATDGKIMAFARVAVQSELAPTEGSIIVPHKMLQELVSNLGDEDSVRVEFDDHQISFRFRSITYLTNLVDGKYPNYMAVVPKEFSRGFRFQRSAMAGAVRRCAILTDLKNLAVSMHFTGDRCVVESENYDRGKIQEEISAVVDGDDFRIGFNHKFVGEVLRSLDSEEVLLQGNQPGTPAVFRAAEASENFYLVMPIKFAETKPVDDADDDDDAPPRGAYPEDSDVEGEPEE